MPPPDDGLSTQDTLFAMPGIDDPPSTEVGVILMGFDTERLLACLGAVTPTDDDPTRVILRVDLIRHGGTIEAVIARGAERWRWIQTALPATDPPSTAALRPLWTYATRAVGGADLGTLGAAARAYLAACWLRRTEVERYLSGIHTPGASHVLPAIDP